MEALETADDLSPAWPRCLDTLGLSWHLLRPEITALASEPRVTVLDLYISIWHLQFPALTF